MPAQDMYLEIKERMVPDPENTENTPDEPVGPTWA